MEKELKFSSKQTEMMQATQNFKNLIFLNFKD